MQQKEVGGNDDLHPVKVITADTHAEWSAKESVPSGMVRSTSWCISLLHYVVHFFNIAYSWMMAVQCHILNYFILNHCRHAAEGSWWKR